jgi:hypothetical protein
MYTQTLDGIHINDRQHLKPAFYPPQPHPTTPGSSVTSMHVCRVARVRSLAGQSRRGDDTNEMMSDWRGLFRR